MSVSLAKVTDVPTVKRRPVMVNLRHAPAVLAACGIAALAAGVVAVASNQVGSAPEPPTEPVLSLTVEPLRVARAVPTAISTVTSTVTSPPVTAPAVTVTAPVVTVTAPAVTTTVTVAAPVEQVAAPDGTWRVMPCTFEDGSDSTLPCYWDGATMGNGVGDSYIVNADETITYLGQG